MAALLDALAPDVDYPLSPSEVLLAVQFGVNGGDDGDSDDPCDCPTLEELLERAGNVRAFGKKAH